MTPICCYPLRAFDDIISDIRVSTTIPLYNYFMPLQRVIREIHKQGFNHPCQVIPHPCQVIFIYTSSLDVTPIESGDLRQLYWEPLAAI